jgi:hypothetical protein
MQRQDPFAQMRKGVFCLSYALGRLFSSAAGARCSAAVAPDVPEAADVAVAVVDAAVAARDEARAGLAAPDGMPAVAAGAPAAVSGVAQVAA